MTRCFVNLRKTGPWRRGFFVMRILLLCIFVVAPGRLAHAQQSVPAFGLPHCGNLGASDFTRATFDDPATFTVLPTRRIELSPFPDHGPSAALPIIVQADSAADVPFRAGGWIAHADGGPRCLLDVRDYVTSPARTLGVHGPSVPAAVLASFFDSNALQDAYSFVLTEGAPAASPQRRVVSCPSHGQEILWVAKDEHHLPDLQLPASWRPPGELFVRLGPDASMCARVVALRDEPSDLTVTLGALRIDTPVASLAKLETPLLDLEHDACNTAVVTGKERPCLDVVELPDGRQIKHIRRRVRLAVVPGLADGQTCPATPPTRPSGARVEALAIDGHAFACVYAERPNGDFVPVDRAGADGGLAAFHFEPCLFKGDLCMPVERSSTQNAWPLRIDGDGQATVGLLVTPASAAHGDPSARASSAVVQRTTVVNHAVESRKAERRLPQNSVSDYCVAPPTDPALVPFVTARAWAPNGAYLDIASFTLASGGLLCPDSRTPPVDATRIDFSIGGSPFLERTLVHDVSVMGFDVVRHGGKINSYVVPTSLFRVNSESIFNDDSLCVDVNDPLVTRDLTEVKVSGLTVSRGEGASRTPFEVPEMRMAYVPREDKTGVRRYCGSMSDIKQPDDLRFVRGDVDIRLDGCDGPPEACHKRLREAPWFFSGQIGMNYVAALNVGLLPNRVFRVGGGLAISLFDAGFRITPNLSFVLVDAGIDLWFSGVVAGQEVFNSAETQHPPGRCVAGCDVVERVGLTSAFGVFGGPCVVYKFLPPYFGVPLCGAAAINVVIDTRAGSGVYQTSTGSIVKVGERGDSHTHFEFGAQATLGLRADFVGW
jgi:hypothetical protein